MLTVGQGLLTGEGDPFQKGVARPVASVRQQTAVLIHSGETDEDVTPLPVEPSGAVPSSLKVDVLP